MADEITHAAGVYTTDYGDFVVADVLAELSTSGVRGPVIELIEHLFERLRSMDVLPYDPALKFEVLVQRVALEMGDVGAIVAGVVSGDSIYGTLQGDVQHRATLINILSRKQRKDWLTMELKKLED